MPTRTRAALAAILLVSALLSGCIAIERAPRVYGGTRAYAGAFGLASPERAGCGMDDIALWIIAPVDLPLTLVMDTVLLPVALVALLL